MSRLSAFLLVALLLPFGLGGCSLSGVVKAVGQASNGPPATIYDLIAPGRLGVRAGVRGWQLVVREPVALRSLRSAQILIKPSAHEISYFGGAKWSDKLPRLLQTRIIESFQNSRALRGVSNGRDRIAADLALMIEVRAFQVELVKGRRAIARISLYAKLIDGRNGVVIGKRLFSGSAATQDDPPDAVESFNGLFGNIVRRIVRWTVRHNLPS